MNQSHCRPGNYHLKNHLQDKLLLKISLKYYKLDSEYYQKH